MAQTLSNNNFAGFATLTGAALLGLLALKYNDRAVFTERREGIPNVPGMPLFGLMFEQIAKKDRFLDFFLEKVEHMDVMTMYVSVLGLPPRIMTIDPAAVEHVLKDNFSNYVKGKRSVEMTNDLFGHGIFAANGEQWRYQRKAASLIFNVVNFRDFFTGKVFVKELNVMSDRILNKKAEQGEFIDFQDVIYKFTLETFVYLGFGKQLGALYNNEKVPFATSFDACQHNCFQRIISPLGSLREALRPILRPSELSATAHIKVIDEFAYGLIAERKEQLAQGHKYKDLLSRFMSARNPEGQELSDKELRDTVLNFIIAGRDTTAQTLSWTIYYLLLHPRVEDKLLAEVNESIPDEIEKDAPALYETIKKMAYAHAVFYEVLRLEPVVPSNNKIALEDDILPDGTHVHKGDQVNWSAYAMGRSKKLWGPDADMFKPERWISPDGELHRESAAKWPAFHAGPRVCLGQALATLEGLVALTILLKRYKFALVPGQEIVYSMSLTHPLKNGLKVFVEKRQ
ncbi:cytochrome P450 [Zychaea mexicana]|uniref:cytochrome P450 n=1 Tax=Zychaea mexicana TaxID=64656 RepID=UPI0022FE9BA0|nr:cytochrome P450 [Zychaea mexicana]KAI9493381.1 cytochrome P450 [Zychaea mexicana]